MFTGALGPVFIANDHNFNWSINDKLDKPARVYTTGLRAGPVFRLPHNPKMNLALWSGFAYSQMKSATEGSIAFNEVFPNADAKLTDTENKLDA